MHGQKMKEKTYKQTAFEFKSIGHKTQMFQLTNSNIGAFDDNR